MSDEMKVAYVGKPKGGKASSVATGFLADKDDPNKKLAYNPGTPNNPNIVNNSGVQPNSVMTAAGLTT